MVLANQRSIVRFCIQPAASGHRRHCRMGHNEWEDLRWKVIGLIINEIIIN